MRCHWRICYIIFVIFLVDNNQHKKAKGVNKNVVAAAIHNEYKDVLLNKNYKTLNE